MLTCVRWWERDAAAIAPSPWAERRKARRRSGDVVDPVVVVRPEPLVLPPPADPSDGGPRTE